MRFDEVDAQIERSAGDLTELQCDSKAKLRIASGIAAEVNKRIQTIDLEPDPTKLHELKTNGIVRIDGGLNQPQLNQVLDHLKTIPVFGGHVPAQSDGVRRYLDKGAREFSFGSYALEDIIQCPHLLELALRPDILSLAAAYLGCTPTIYSMNSWWSFPQFSPAMTQDYHRDVDDYRFLALFIYLTDVVGGQTGGQHQFIIRTHDEEAVVKLLKGDTEKASSLFMPKLRKLGYKQAHVYESLFADQITDITGPAGSMFLADTYALHKGVPPKTNDRLVCWLRYGLRKNLAYNNDKTKPVPFRLIEGRVQSDELTRYMLRVLAGGDDSPTEPPTYKVQTDEGVCIATLEDYSWQRASFSSPVSQPNPSVIVQSKASRIRQKLSRFFSS